MFRRDLDVFEVQFLLHNITASNVLLFQKSKTALTFEELTTIRKNLETQGIAVDSEFIRDSWHHLFR